MLRIALRMLTQDSAKYIGMVLSLSFSALIITQQSSIFVGVMKRTYSIITDTGQADIWVMDPNVQFIDDVNPLRDTDLYRVKSIPGVAWAVPFYKGLIRARLANGKYQICNLYGIDDATLIGAPHTMLDGSIQDLRAPDAVIVNRIGAIDKLAQKNVNGATIRPLGVGDVLELNDRRACVVGICEVKRTFQSQPVIYTTYNRALQYTPYERKLLSFILVKAAPGQNLRQLCQKISKITGFAAYTNDEFEQLTMSYYLKYTGIPLNFGIAVLLGLLVGAAIAGQIFYNFTSDNLRYLALLAVMGASKNLLAMMTILQALWVALLGWCVGSGAAAFIGFVARDTELSFFMPWQLLFGTGIIIMLICINAALISISRIYRLELGMVTR